MHKAKCEDCINCVFSKKNNNRNKLLSLTGLASFGSWALGCCCIYPDYAIDLSPTAVLKIALNILPALLWRAVEQIALINKRDKSHPLINRLFCSEFFWKDSEGRGYWRCNYTVWKENCQCFKTILKLCFLQNAKVQHDSNLSKRRKKKVYKILKIEQFSLVLLRWDCCELWKNSVKWALVVLLWGENTAGCDDIVNDHNWDFSKAIHACMCAFDAQDKRAYS